MDSAAGSWANSVAAAAAATLRKRGHRRTAYRQDRLPYEGCMGATISQAACDRLKPHETDFVRDGFGGFAGMRGELHVGTGFVGAVSVGADRGAGWQQSGVAAERTRGAQRVDGGGAGFQGCAAHLLYVGRRR